MRKPGGTFHDIESGGNLNASMSLSKLTESKDKQADYIRLRNFYTPKEIVTRKERHPQLGTAAVCGA